MDGAGFWEVDVSTPITIDGVARPLPRDGLLPLGLSRGTRLSRPKQIDFMQRFMAAPFVPSFALGPGLSILRALSLPFGNDWFTSVLGQFHFQKFVTSVRKAKLAEPSDSSSWTQLIRRQLANRSLYDLGFCSEFLITPDDILLVAYEAHGATETARKKAVFHHKFPHHDLTLEAAWPGLFVDKQGNYWDVPVSMAADLASVTSDSGVSYHLCLQHILGSAKQVKSGGSGEVPATVLPGLSLKSAFSLKRSIDFWRSQAKKLKMVQPFDIFLSNPHVSATGIVGVLATALVGENAVRSQAGDEPEGYRRFNLYASGLKSAFLADLFASLSFSAQHGNFQRWFFDLTRFHIRLDVPSGSKFLSAAAFLANDLYNSRQPSREAIQAVCPTASLSFQQQIIGPFSFRVDSGVAVNLHDNRKWKVNLENPVLAIEYALHVLGSAKAVAWYAPQQKEFMVELRLFER